MLEITSIKNGIVLDHIKAGVGVKIFKYLKLDKVNSEVALIINAKSNKKGRKDIIKIEDITSVDYMVLGMLSPGITINEVKDQVIVNKIKPELPKVIENTIECKNKSCITQDEKYIPQIFTLVNEETGSYKCEYCEQMIHPSEVN